MRKCKRGYCLLLILICLLVSACTKPLDIGKEPATGEDNSQVSDSQEIPLKEMGIDITGTYDNNDLLIQTLEKEYEGILIEIPQIEGLKDHTIQEKINADMLERVQQACNKISSLMDVTYITMANFSNVLSIGVYLGGEGEYEQVYLNYNLVNGNSLSFEELFMSDADTLEIVREAFRSMLITDQMQGDYDENKLYKIVKNYMEADNKKFAFTPAGIYFYYKDYVASVKMLDIADDVCIYSKYLTKDSIYEQDNIGRKDIFTCVDVPEDSLDIWEYGLLEDNLWYDIMAYNEYFVDEPEDEVLEKYLSFKDETYSDMMEKVADYREIAKDNPQNFYIVLLKPFIRIETKVLDEYGTEYYTDMAYVSENLQIYEMPMTTYEQIYKDKLLEEYRYEYLLLRGGIYLEVEESDVICTNKEKEMYYNYLTGEQIIRE